MEEEGGEDEGGRGHAEEAYYLEKEQAGEGDQWGVSFSLYSKRLVHKLGVERTVHLTQNIKTQI